MTVGAFISVRVFMDMGAFSNGTWRVFMGVVEFRCEGYL